MEKEILVFLLQKHIAGTLTEAEKNELAAYINRKQSKEVTTSALEDLLLQHTPAQEFDEKRFGPLITGILKADLIAEEELENADSAPDRDSFQKPRKRRIWLILALLIIAVATSAYFYYFKPSVPAVVSNNKPLLNNAAPGGNKAILTISDGSTFSLDSITNGFITQQGNVKLIKTANGELKYNPSSEMNASILFNTVTTPRGGQYQILFSDGSRVKLNSSSSITYPVVFTGAERNVTITGEAYFEIAKNSRMPFKVRAYDMEVEVQGTQFNINSYIDEPTMTTTLLKGSLKLSKDSLTSVLEPLQQGQFDKEGKFVLEKDIDINEVVAWRNGLFEFNNTDLKIVMRQLARWYDVDIVYEKGSPTDQEIVGKLRRDVNLSEVIALLEKNDIRCKIEGKTFFILP